MRQVWEHLTSWWAYPVTLGALVAFALWDLSGVQDFGVPVRGFRLTVAALVGARLYDERVRKRRNSKRGN